MNDLKRQEIKDLIISLWDSYEDKTELAKHIENGYIFGEYANNEHYMIDSLTAIIAEVYLEKNPPPVVEPIIEEPIVE